MVNKPPLPEDVGLPETIGDWTHDPESNKNGHTWYSQSGDTAVAVLAPVDTVYVAVLDERCIGLERGERIFETCIPEDADRQQVKREFAGEAVNAAIDWMQDNDPQDWACPRVCESVFDTPDGYQLAMYEIGLQSSTIYYYRTGAAERSSLGSREPPEEVSTDTYPYLTIEVYRGSGNATVSLAPWTRAHDHEMEEVVETPEECGLDVALTMARQYLRENVDGISPSEPAVGQSDLGAWG